MQLQHTDPHAAIAAQLRDLAPHRANGPSELNVTPAASSEPTSEPSLRTTPLNDNTSDMRIPIPHGRSGRGVVLLAICAGVAATMAWHSYGDEAKQRLSYLMPQLPYADEVKQRLSSFVPQLFADVPATQSANAAEPKDAPSQIAASEPAADPAPAQESSNVEPATPTSPAPASAVPAPAQPMAETSPTQAALPPELTQSIETMAREIASLKQTVEQLQVGQQQLSHDVAKVSEHKGHRKLAEQTSKPTSRPRSRQAPTSAARSRTLAPYSPPQAHSQGQTYPQGPAQREAYIPPSAPTQLPPQSGDSSVPRPPMPLQ
jgi:hypothetical protein